MNDHEHFQLTDDEFAYLRRRRLRESVELSDDDPRLDLLSEVTTAAAMTSLVDQERWEQLLVSVCRLAAEAGIDELEIVEALAIGQRLGDRL